MNFAQMCSAIPVHQVMPVFFFSILSLATWHVPFIRWLVYPFQLFNTFTHELSHGMAALLTGGSFQRFSVHPNLSGLAWSSGGIRVIVLNAGYLGSAIAGGLVLVIAAHASDSGVVLLSLGVLLGVLCLLFVRNLFGVLSGFGLSALFVWTALAAPVDWHHLLLLFLAVQMMLNALNSLYELWRGSTQGQMQGSDAHAMQAITVIPAPIWALGWSLGALGIFVLSLGIAYCPGVLPAMEEWLQTQLQTPMLH